MSLQKLLARHRALINTTQPVESSPFHLSEIRQVELSDPEYALPENKPLNIPIVNIMPQTQLEMPDSPLIENIITNINTDLNFPSVSVLENAESTTLSENLLKQIARNERRYPRPITEVE